MRRFEVGVCSNYQGIEETKEILEFPDDTPEKEIQEECEEALQGIISTYIGSWWHEIDDEGREI